ESVLWALIERREADQSGIARDLRNLQLVDLALEGLAAAFAAERRRAVERRQRCRERRPGLAVEVKSGLDARDQREVMPVGVRDRRQERRLVHGAGGIGDVDVGLTLGQAYCEAGPAAAGLRIQNGVFGCARRLDPGGPRQRAAC